MAEKKRSLAGGCLKVVVIGFAAILLIGFFLSWQHDRRMENDPAYAAEYAAKQAAEAEAAIKRAERDAIEKAEREKKELEVKANNERLAKIKAERVAKWGEGYVTMRQYNAIQEGMTYDQVCEILGKRGEEISSNSVGGHYTVMYMWQAGGGANMNAMFQDGGLVSKAQMGLR